MRASLICAVSFCLTAQSLAGDVHVIRNVNLRLDPSTGQDPIRLLQPPERLQLIDFDRSGGYLNVRTNNGDEGWVWARNTWLVSHYCRNDWHPRWEDADGDCQDSRQEVLIRQSEIPPQLSANGCRVESGRWTDPYTGQVFTDPSDLDIDHVVPLENANKSGGWSWSRADKRAYANNLQEPDHLLAVRDVANQAKGSRHPADYMPPNAAFRCDYVRMWREIKQRYGLSMTPRERAAIVGVEAGCP